MRQTEVSFVLLTISMLHSACIDNQLLQQPQNNRHVDDLVNVEVRDKQITVVFTGTRSIFQLERECSQWSLLPGMRKAVRELYFSRDRRDPRWRTGERNCPEPAVYLYLLLLTLTPITRQRFEPDLRSLWSINRKSRIACRSDDRKCLKSCLVTFRLRPNDHPAITRTRSRLCCFCSFQIMVTFASAVNGPMFSLFLMGGLSRHANWKVIISSLFLPLSLISARFTVLYKPTATDARLSVNTLNTNFNE